MSEITNFSTLDTAHLFEKKNFTNLKKTDLFELSLFVLYILGKLPEYNTVVNLMMLNTQNAFMRICEYFGGQTITIPTIQESQNALRIIQMYNMIDIQGLPYATAVMETGVGPDEIVGYNKLKVLLEACGVTINEAVKETKANKESN